MKCYKNKPAGEFTVLMQQRLTDHDDGADSFASSGSVLHTDAVAATVFSFDFADVEAEVAGGAVEADLLVCLQLLVVLCPGDSWRWFATVASWQSAAVTHLYYDFFPKLQVQTWWLWGGANDWIFFYTLLIWKSVYDVLIRMHSIQAADLVLADK